MGLSLRRRSFGLHQFATELVCCGLVFATQVIRVTSTCDKSSFFGGCGLVFAVLVAAGHCQSEKKISKKCHYNNTINSININSTPILERIRGHDPRPGWLVDRRRWGCTRHSFMHGRSRMTIVVCGMTLASLLCRDGACRVFTDQTDIACSKGEAP